jgi:hypothetical protein
MKEAFEKMTGMPDAWTNPALMVSRNAFIQGWEARTQHDVDATIIQYHEATIKRLEKRVEGERMTDMTEADYNALSQKQLASLKRDTRISLEDAAVRATHKVMAELGEEAMKDEDDDIQVYQRPWVGLTEAQFLEAVRLAENGNYLVAFVRIQEWLKEKNT